MAGETLIMKRNRMLLFKVLMTICYLPVIGFTFFNEEVSATVRLDVVLLVMLYLFNMKLIYDLERQQKERAQQDERLKKLKRDHYASTDK